MHIKLFATLLIIPLANIAFGQYNFRDSILDVNNVSAQINPSGTQFCNNNSGGAFEVPINSNRGTIYSSSLWLGGVDINNSLHIAAEINPTQGVDFFPGPLPLSPLIHIDSATSEIYNRVWHIMKEEVDEYLLKYQNPLYPEYIIPESILGWPAHSFNSGYSYYLAPFFDVDNDGCYNPFGGDYPDIRGDECIFFVFNDQLYYHSSTGGMDLLNFEIRGMAYAFNCPENDAFHNTVFLNYKIISRSDISFYNMSCGILTDFDIGYPTDDYVGCDVQRNCYYGYNADDWDNNLPGNSGYGYYPPAQATVILVGPKADDDGIDNTMYDEFGNPNLDFSTNGINCGDEIVDNEKYGMSRFASITGGGNPAMSDPQTAIEFYNYLRGYWRDGSPFCYGGTGHPSGGGNTSIPARFLFPGNSDPVFWGTNGIAVDAWDENTAPNYPGDRRGLGISGPYTMHPGHIKEIDIAYVYARSQTDEINSVELLLSYVDEIRNAFVSNQTPCGNEIIHTQMQKNTTAGLQIKLFPNPANQFINISFSNIDYQSVNVIIRDINARVMGSYKISDIIQENIIDVSAYPEGIYIVEVKSKSQTSFTKLSVMR